jgi:surface polysaccharide O-acyltransferase-like enzyme
MNSLDLSYIITGYFLFIFLFGDSRSRIHSVIICLSSLLNILFQLPLADTPEQYIYNRNVFILWDGATALILTMFLLFDKTAWKQALLLAFAVLCHSMVTYDLSIASSWFTLFFYNYYDELIITVGLLQMMASHDGLIRSFNNLQELLFSGFFHNNGNHKGLSSQEKRKARA